MPTTTLTSKGQITLPKEVREHLHVAEGDRLEFVIEPDGLVRVKPVSGSVRDLYGCLGSSRSLPALDEIEEELVRTLAADDARIRSGHK